MKLTSALLRRAANLAAEKAKVQQTLTDAFISRYGVTYSEIDSDSIIDVLDYHGGHLTLKECDRLMTEAGYPPIPSPSSGEVGATAVENPCGNRGDNDQAR